MSGTREVISAFLDDEPFDPQELVTVLSDPAGRALLIDLIALRQIVQPIEAAPATRTAAPARRQWRTVAAAAVLFLALAGGYVAGGRRAVTTASEAPAPTRVVEAVPFVPTGGIR